MRTPTAELIQMLDDWRPRRVVVVGDYMLDRYVYGNAQRLSPDAPVPVLAVEREEWKPGGASNVSLDLAALKCKVDCLGLVGADDEGQRLKQTLRAAGCGVAGLVADRQRPTTIKQNFVGLAQHRHPQKMFRVDVEKKLPVEGAVAQRLIAAGVKLIARADVLCIEDYNKGVLTDAVTQALIAAARKRRVPVLVDPAAIEDYTKYRGATCITPNRTEAQLATGLDANNPAAMARKLLRTLDLETVVLTLDKHGAMLLERGGQPLIAPTQARSVYDVTGAGDMVLAMLAGARGNGIAWPAAVDLANVAAGLEVERFGVVPIHLHEVLLSLLERQNAQLGKIRTLDQLLPELDAYRMQGRQIAFTNGCFDILHAGHVAYLRQARAQGDLLVVGVNSDQSIRRIKGEGRPVNQEADRLLVLSELQSVDYVIVFNDDTPMKLLRAIRPHVLVKGGDYTKDKVVGADFVESYGGEVRVVDMIQGRSTTNIIQRVQAQKR